MKGHVSKPFVENECVLGDMRDPRFVSNFPFCISEFHLHLASRVPPLPILLHARGQTLLILFLLRYSLREHLQLLQNNLHCFNGENCESSGLIRLH